MLLGALKHPYLRHLLELYFNNSVTARGALILGHLGYAGCDEKIVHSLPHRGNRIVFVDINDTGIRAVHDIRDAAAEREWFRALIDSIASYSCRDTGEGVCLGSDHFETAIYNQDVNVLNRVVDPVSGEFLMQLDASLNTFTDDARLASQKYWSPRFQDHSGAEVMTPIFDFGDQIWSFEANEICFEVRSAVDPLRSYR